MRKILCLSVSGSREEWTWDTLHLPFMDVLPDTCAFNRGTMFSVVIQRISLWVASHLCDRNAPWDRLPLARS